MKEQTPHPILPLITPEQAVAMGEQAFIAAFNRREEMIAQEKHDPLKYGWEPPIWKVVDSLLGWERYGWVDADYAEAMRRHCGYEKPVQIVLINGGNRASKSEDCGKRTQMLLNQLPKERAWLFHSSEQNSVEYQQALMWAYMPPELRRSIRSEVTYITYNQKNGFTDNKFVLPNGSECSFRNYGQDIQLIEGGEVKIVWASELIPPEWVETLALRIATKDGFMLIDFTPVTGYTPTVKMFQDGARVVQESVAFLLPKDGGEPDVDRAMAVENVDAWLEGKSGQPEVPEGRKFEMVPRVMRCAEDHKAVVFFHSSDNPYGNPRGVWNQIQSIPADDKRMRFYGVASKQASARFPKFKVGVHTIADDQIPPTGTNYLFVDPASARNFFMQWWRFTPEEAFIVAEWPGNYEIPNIGFPGPWAVPDGRKPDGRPGPAQRAFGFGLIQYKQEIARIEGWKDAEKKRSGDTSESEWVKGWIETNGSRMEVYMRYMDSRFASAQKAEDDRPVTLLEQFDDIGLTFLPTPGDDIAEGVQMLNDLLYYDENKPIDFFNKPKLRIADSCKNTIFAFQTWTGADGQKGATTDPIACARYAALADCQYVGPVSKAGGGDDDDDEYEGGHW